jgi:predicted PhzF superfamily epimerase YddE/YHI9
MRALRYDHVDVFTARPCAGDPQGATIDRSSLFAVVVIDAWVAGEAGPRGLIESGV